VAALFWPGVATYDTVAQYEQVLSGKVDDWHPPAMVRLWQLLRSLGEGTAPLFVLQVALYAAGFALIVAALVRDGRWRAAMAAAIVAPSPLMLGWQMVVLKDTQMLAALVAAVGIVGHYRLANRRIPVVAAGAAVLLIAYASLVRANAIFATAPLAVMLLPTKERPLLASSLALGGVAALIALTPVISHDLFRAQPSDVAKSEPLFDLAGIAVRSPSGAPSPFPPAERAEIIRRHCVKAFFWDSLSDPAGCGDVTKRLLHWPADRLYFTLAREAATHPLAYAEQRLSHWNSTERWLVPPGLPDAGPPDENEPNAIGLTGPESDWATTWQDGAATEAGTPLGWPILWTSIAALLLPVAWRRRADPVAGLALALVVSAVALELSFLAISIASDLRYHLWPMTASALALVILSNYLQLRRREWVAASAVLALVVAAGLFARSTLPPAPEDYDAMIRATSG
jgi:hypothetical protein